MLNVEHACALLIEIAQLEKNRQDLYLERSEHIKAKLTGKADICEELIENTKVLLALKKDNLRTLERNLDLEIEYGWVNGTNVAMKIWQLNGRKPPIELVKSHQEVKEKAENFISDCILGAYDSTDTT
jgi:hypothetical protein